MHTPRFSIGEAVRFGWAVAKRNVGFFFVLLVILAIVNGIPSRIQQSAMETAPFVAFLFGLVSFVVGQITGIGVTKITLRFVDGERPRYDDLYTLYPLFFKYLFATILYGLIVFAGLILLVVPGIIWAVRYSQYGFLVVDKSMAPMESLRTSAEMTRGSRWNLFLFGLVLFGVIIVGALALLIGLLWAVPTAMVAAAFVYRKLLGATALAPQPTSAPLPSA